jgi:hypothetical protein
LDSTVFCNRWRDRECSRSDIHRYLKISLHDSARQGWRIRKNWLLDIGRNSTDFEHASVWRSRNCVRNANVHPLGSGKSDIRLISPGCSRRSS